MHPKASSFRVSGFRWEEEGKALFEGVSATGKIGWGPASQCPKPTSAASSTTLEGEREEHNDSEDISLLNDQNAPNTKHVIEPEVTDVGTSKKKKKVNDIDMKFEKLLDMFTSDAESVKESSGPPIVCAPTLIDCCKKLDEMQLNRTDLLYAQAAVIFSEEKMREQWIQWCDIVEDSTSRMNWLKSMLKMKNVI